VETTTRTRSRRGRLRDAVAELLDREFTISVGHLIALVNGCAFAPSLLVFWAVNGVLDFSTAIALGATGGPGGLAVRIVAYLLLVPTFVLLRVGYYLVHPRHRRTVLAGSCPNARLLRLDWFSVGILATGLPFSLQSAGPWLAANVVFLVGVFLLPRALPARLATPTKLAALAGGSLLFLYANYGGLVPVVPDPAATLGVVATLRLSDATTATLVRATNSLLVGPGLVALFALAANRIMTRPELTSLPLVRRTLPTRDAAGTVATSAALGTGFYLLVVVLATGELRLLP
jgi:hypothetical protein